MVIRRQMGTQLSWTTLIRGLSLGAGLVMTVMLILFAAAITITTTLSSIEPKEIPFAESATLTFGILTGQGNVSWLIIIFYFVLR